MYKVLIPALMLVLSACSDTVEETGNHVWMTQTDTLDKARDVEGVLMDSRARQQQEIDEQAR